MANIDDELAFLRDAKEGEGLISREAIADALDTIFKDKAYPPHSLKVTQNGEYESDPDYPYDEIIADVGDYGPLYDGEAPRFTITKNGKYYSNELFGKNLLITEFDVDVPKMLTELYPLSVNQNGTYARNDANQAYETVTVNVVNAKNPGDYVTASMYFRDPNNPNDASMIFVDSDDHILFGDSAKAFLDRFPKFKPIGDYIHNDWNPKPDVITSDQWYTPEWIKGAKATQTTCIDYDIFLYIVRHKVLRLFYNTSDDLVINVNGQIITLDYVRDYVDDPLIDADNHEFNYCFSISAEDDQARYRQYVMNNDHFDFKLWYGDDKMAKGNFYGHGIWKDGNHIYYSYGYTNEDQYELNISTNTWVSKIWNGVNYMYGYTIWTDNGNVYSSRTDNEQYVLNKLTDTWEIKNWYVSPKLAGNTCWTDGTNIYCSYFDKYGGDDTKIDYVLNKTTDTWEHTNWTGVETLDEYCYGKFWSDGINGYYSDASTQYVLNKITNNWDSMTWNGFVPKRGGAIWSDGNTIYYSSYNSSTHVDDQYYLDIANSTWYPVTWTGLNVDDHIYGTRIWTDGTDYYHTYENVSYILIDKTNKIWQPITFTGYIPYNGNNIWNDGTNTYYTYTYNIDTSYTYIFNKNDLSWTEVIFYGIPDSHGMNAANIWTDGTNTYYSYRNLQYILDVNTRTWYHKTWYSHDIIKGLVMDDHDKNIWTDGTDYYCRVWDNDSDSYYYDYILDKPSSTWTHMPSLNFSHNAIYIWSDGTDTYCSYGTSHSIFDKTNKVWISKTWHGLTDFYGDDIWSDGTNTYCSFGKADPSRVIHYYHYILDKSIDTWTQINLNLISVSAKAVWSDSTNTYYSPGSAFTNPRVCNEDMNNISTESPVDGLNYYWWGCSLGRALLNKNRNLLVRNADREEYDYCNWDIHHIIPQELFNDIYPITHYVFHPKQVASDNPNKYKTVPRKNLTIEQSQNNTYEKVENPTGNPQEQGWYQYRANNNTFYLTSHTSVQTGTNYFFARPGYILSVEEPTVTDEYNERTQTGWSNYELGLKHSPILYITQVGGLYKVYKKVNNNLVEYKTEEHLNFVFSHVFYDVNTWLEYWMMLEVRKKIRDVEQMGDYLPPILMENVYYLGKVGGVNQCIYLYDKTIKVYYSFRPDLEDESDVYTYCIRHSYDTEPNYINNIDAGIANGSYTRIIESRIYGQSSGNGKGHAYIKEYDIWPDEQYQVPASGDYFEKKLGTHVDEDTGDLYSVLFCYDHRSYSLDEFKFYNYYDIVNGITSCIPEYHYKSLGDNNYIIERTNTDYAGFTSEKIEYYSEYITDKVSDKFITENNSNILKNNIYAPPYYTYIYEEYIYNIINTPLIEQIKAINTINLGHLYGNIFYEFINYYYLPNSTKMSESRNYNRNLNSDEWTIYDFNHRSEMNASRADLYPLYSYEEANSIWQNYYDSFTRDYTLSGTKTPSGFPISYDTLYFYM